MPNAGIKLAFDQTINQKGVRMLPYNKKLKPFSQTLRGNMTEAEQKLWKRLRRKQMLGVQFYRQKPIAGYITDFYCSAADLVIELDGSQHFEKYHLKNDIERDAILQALGLQVLRFDNRQVMLEIDVVMNVIFNVVAQRLAI